MSADVPDLPIRSAQGRYVVRFSAGVRAALEAAATLDDPFFLVDTNVLRLYAADMQPILGSRNHLAVDATEEEKTLTGVTRVVDWLQGRNATKRSTIVAVGGGIVQDIACFSAHIYYRGIRWVHVPTTLLSMSDSCIGAKCALNLNDFKNQLGAFHSPSAVFVATTFLRTLSDTDVASGYGEILKLLLTGPSDGLDRLDRAVSVGGLRNAELPALIYESLAVKKVVIEEDEYERDRRRVLNYGHTFGHALESLTAHEVPHGLAVAWGLDLVNHIAAARGLVDPRFVERVHVWIAEHLPVRLSRSVTASDLIGAARRDKKASVDEVNLIVLEAPGMLKVMKVRFDADLEKQVSDYLTRYEAASRR